MIILVFNPVIAQIDSDNSKDSNEDTLDLEPSTGTRRASATDAVFAEYFTTGWCVYCPSAASNLKGVYNCVCQSSLSKFEFAQI